MAVFELTVRTAVRGYHIYKEVWPPAIGEEFVCRQERDNDHDRHAVSVHKEGDDVLGHLPREISSVAFFFLEHDGCITYTYVLRVGSTLRRCWSSTYRVYVSTVLGAK